MSQWERMMTRADVLERTGMNEEMLDRAIRLGFLPGPEGGCWPREVIDAFIESLGAKSFVLDDE
jgi:hypothetical protein